MGKHRDMTQRKTLARVDDLNRRNRVYEKNYAVDSKAVENILQVDSLVPTAVRDRSLLLDAYQIAMIFLSRTHFLTQFGFCLYLMLIMDLMHEPELGILKAVFIHFLRILDWTDGMHIYSASGSNADGC
jgi:hypothetical protein